VSETEQETCNLDGQWDESVACPYACVDAACGGSCVPGVLRCEGLVRQRCSGQGEWYDDGSRLRERM
jgi:hypothetical protein